MPELWHGSKWPKGVPYEITGYDKPLFSILDETAHDYPDKTYTVFNDFTRTFSQVKDTADRVAHFLVSRGIRPKDRVAIFLPNLPHYPEIFFGILKAGGVCVTCNPLYKASELNFQLKDSGARGVFVMDHPEFYATAVKAFVQLKPGETATEEEFLEFCKSRLSGYKRPRSIEFRESLPTSVVGKVLRRVLRDEAIKKLKKA